MMVNVTFSLDEGTVRRLRRAAKTVGGGRKGAISEIVESALSERLREIESRENQEEFVATLNHKEVAKALSLRELATQLQALGLDPRETTITSTAPLEPVGRVGLRVYRPG